MRTEKFLITIVVLIAAVFTLSYQVGGQMGSSVWVPHTTEGYLYIVIGDSLAIPLGTDSMYISGTAITCTQNGFISLVALAQGGATIGQALKWDGSVWAPDDDNITAVDTVTGALMLVPTSGEGDTSLTLDLDTLEFAVDTGGAAVTLRIYWNTTTNNFVIDGGEGLTVLDSVLVVGPFYMVHAGGADTTMFDTTGGFADGDVWIFNSTTGNFEPGPQVGGSGGALLEFDTTAADAILADSVVFEETPSIQISTISGGTDRDTVELSVIPGGVDHGGLSGLTDDDHTQYLKESDTNAFALALLLSGDTAIGESLGSYFDTAAVIDTIQDLLTAAGYLTAETDPTLTDDGNVSIGDNSSTVIRVTLDAANDGWFQWMSILQSFIFSTGADSLGFGGSFLLSLSGYSSSDGPMLKIENRAASGADSGSGIRLESDPASGTSLSNDHQMGFLDFGGVDGVGARIAGYADEAQGANDLPGRLDFYTVPDGSTTRTKRMTIDKDGVITKGADQSADSALMTTLTIGKEIEDSLDEYQLALADADVLTEAEVTDTLTARGFLTSETGDIEGVTAGAGLTGGGTSGTVTVTVGAGTGITVNADDVAATLGTDIVTGEIVDQTITKSDIDTTASNFVFDDAYRGTSATADSLYATVKFVRDSSGGVTLAVLNDTLTNYATVGELTNALNTEPVVAGNGRVWGTWGELGYDWDYDIDNAWAPNAATADTSIRGPMYASRTNDDSTDNTHFTIEYFPGGFAGYEYWMLFTPLWHFRFENCVLMVRNKGDNWHPWIDSLNGTYDTMPNPIVDVGDWYNIGGAWECDTTNAGSYGGTNGLVLGHPCFGTADFSFFYEGKDPNKLWVIGQMGFDGDVVNDSTASCSCDSIATFVFSLGYSSSGMAIGTPTVVLPPDSIGIIGSDTVANNSPTVHYVDDSTYYMWGVRARAANHPTTVWLWKNEHFPVSPFFTRVGTTNLQAPDTSVDKIWHLAVKKAGRNRFVALMDLAAKSGGNGTEKSGFALSTSLDYNGLTWDAAPGTFWEENPKTTAWDGNFGYRSDFYWVRDLHRMYGVMYYSGDSSNTTSAGGQTFIYFDPIVKEATIWSPDLINDTVKFVYVDPQAYPDGIGIKELGFELDNEAAYSLQFQVWTVATDTAAPTYSSVIDTVIASAGAGKKKVLWNEMGDRDYMIAAGSYIYVLLPSTDVGFITPRMVFYELAKPLTTSGSYIR